MTKNYYHKTKDKFAFTLYDLLRQKSVDDISVTELCQKANLSRETFYYHFDSLYDLIGWIYYAQTNWFSEKYYDKIPYNQVLIKIFDAMNTIRVFYNKAFQDRHYENLERSMINHNIVFFERMITQQTGETSFTEEIKFLIFYHACAWTATIKEWLVSDTSLTSQELAHYILRGTDPVLKNIFTGQIHQKETS